jgi:excisionase family DNA binding protein
MILVNKKPSVPKLLNSHGEKSLLTSDIRLLDIRGAAERLTCSERFIRRLVQERRIPFVKLGGTRVRFLGADLDQWIVNQRIEAKR